MADKLNKSGNRRGMSEGSRKALKKEFTRKERQENGSKGADKTNVIKSLTKTACEIAKEEAEAEITTRKGEKMILKRALIKKLVQMAMNNNLNALILLLKLLGEMPADKKEINNINGLTVQVMNEDIKNKIDKL